MDFQTCWDLFFLYGKVPSLPLGPDPLYGFYVGILGPLGSYPPYGRVGRAPEEVSQSYFLVKCPLKDPRLALSPNQGTGPGHLGPSHPKVPKGLDRS